MTTVGGLGVETPRSRPSGWWGMVLLIATEATLIASLIGSYFYLHFNSAQWPQGDAPDPKVVLPLVLTAVLVATSVPMQLASRFARARRGRGAWIALLVALAVQSGYLVAQLFLYADDVERLHPEQTAYASVYLVLLGAAHAHVAIGILFNLFLLARLATGLTSYRVSGVRAVTLYWHFVNVATVAVVFTQISPRL
jgi:cytochrome c oxidase subunit III